MARSTQQMLDDCDAAMAAIETGAQGYSARSRAAQKARYQELAAERARLIQQVQQEADSVGQMSSLAIMTRPT